MADAERAPGPITYTRVPADAGETELARAVGGIATVAYGHPTAPAGIVISVIPDGAEIKLAAWPRRDDRK